jgi:HemY protein
MIRVVLFLLLVAAIAFGAAWLAERPGDVAITWMGWRIETSLMVGLAAVAVLVAVLMLLWSLLRLLLRSPRLMAQARRARRRRRGERAISNGLVAVASGDMRAARRAAGDARRYAGDEPLALLLEAQSAQLAGDRAQADAAFRAMADKPETRLLGLRGLYVEAQRRGDAEAGRRYAEEAARSAPALPWAGQAVFDFRSAAGDWQGALGALDANLRSGLVDRPTYRRHRAVLLTAQAMEAEDRDAASAKSLAQEAVKLAPDLVPAVAIAARLSAEASEARRAARLIEAAWPNSPHPDLAEIYIHLRSGDSARDRMSRARELVRLAPGHREGALALARAAIDAREFTTARQTLEPLLRQPTQRVAMLMAELEEMEHGDSGRAREWMARAMRVRGDPRWTADGIVSERWLPASPVSGRVDAFVWTAPSSEVAMIAPVEPQPAPSTPMALPAAGRLETPGQAIDPVQADRPLEAEVHEKGKSVSVASSPPPQPPAAPAAVPQHATLVSKSPASAPRREAVIPLMHAPDDPGTEPDGSPDLRSASAKVQRL